MVRNCIIYNEFSSWRFDVKKAQDSFIWTSDSKKLIDFTSGWNVTNLGWNHPEVTEAIVRQARKNTYASMWSADEKQNEYARALSVALPKELAAVGRATGGTEANEEALKTARAFTGRKKIIGFTDTYHGQSFGTMSIGYRPEYVASFSPLVPEFIHLDFPQTYRADKTSKEILDKFATTLEVVLSKRDVAAIVTEAGIITGWGTTYVAPKGYLKLVRELTKKYGTLMILDEVGTGFSRCGRLFGLELDGVVPDIVTFAKGISNGAAAIGAMVTTDEIANATYNKTNLVSTFGWVPISCAAALKTLQIHQRDRVWEKAERDGNYLLQTLRKELGRHPNVGDVRGIGMEIGVDFVKNKESKEPDGKFAAKVIDNAFHSGLHLVLGDGGNIQLMPPLTIERSVLDKGIEIFVDVLRNV